MKVYIAGPMICDDDYNQEAFFEATKKLEELRWEPVHTEGLTGGLAYEEYLEKSLEMLKGCDAICLLEDWGKSRVAVMEYAYARSMGLPEIRL